MSEIVVLGGGVSGLAAGLMLARDGHRVTLLERDPSPVPESFDAAWESWGRAGVTQFRQAHILQSRGKLVLDAELPDVRDATLAAGGIRFDYMKLMPPSVADREPRPGDDRLATVTARRPVFEHALAQAADAQEGLEVVRGAVATGLDVVDGRVQGVHVGGERLRADLVVDAMGRRSPLPRLLPGASVEEEAEDSGFIYYTRYYRGDMPVPRSALNTPFESFSVLTLPADNRVWSVTLYATTGDRPLKAFRDPAAFTATVRACPMHAHWLEGEPISDIAAMGGVQDRRRRLRGVRGLALLGDAWACTNPSLGRGMSFALWHAALLREHAGDPEAFAEATERELGPWYDATVSTDRARLAEMEAARTGGPYVVPADPASRLRAALPLAARTDADAFRALLEIANLVTLPGEVFARPGLAEKVLAAARARADAPRVPGPGRGQLLEILSSAGAPAAAG